jgi:hypothetical protein
MNPDYRDPSRDRAISWTARLSWICAIPCALFILLASFASPFIALDFGYVPLALILFLPPLSGMALALWGRRGSHLHQDVSFMVNTRREANWGIQTNAAILVWSLLALAVLGGRVADLQENRDSAAMVKTGSRMARVALICNERARRFNKGWPSSMRELLESGLVNPADIAMSASNLPILERVSRGDKSVTDKDIEAAVGFKYLGDKSGIRAKQGEHKYDSVAMFSLGRAVRGRIALSWSDGMSEQIDPNDLDRQLPQ